MAKVKAAETEEQIAVIAQLLSDTQKNIQQLRKATEEISANKELYKTSFELATKTTTESLKAFTAQEITSMNQASRNVVRTCEESIKKIRETSGIALNEIQNTSKQKIREAKQVYWLAGIVALVLGITTIFLEVNRSIDKETIAKAIQERETIESWKLDLKQWMEENPKDSKSFLDWMKKRGAQ